MKLNQKQRPAGFTLVEIMIVVAIIGLLAVICIPNFIRSRATVQANACINNLRKIDAAINQFAMENGKNTGDAVSEANVQPYIKLNANGSIPKCPAGGVYDASSWRVARTPRCSFIDRTPSHNLPDRYF
jgi:prepilin-type N-terminal cleavage/methylation domain-containing protein